MRKRERKISSKHSKRKEKPLPLRILATIIEYLELILLSIFYAIVNLLSLIWKHKVNVIKFLFIALIVVYCILTTDLLFKFNSSFEEFKVQSEEKNNEIVNELEQEKQKSDELQNQLDATKIELEEVKVSKAEKKRQEEETEKARKEQEAKEAEQKRLALASASVTSRSQSESRSSGGIAEYQEYARQKCAEYGWGDGDFQSLVTLWNKESGWNPNSHNKSSGAHGIPQALPASKMASYGSDYMTNYKVQIDWGLNYIKGRYGSPSSALSFWYSHNWY